MKIIMYIILVLGIIANVSAQDSFKSKGLLGGSISGYKYKDDFSIEMINYVGCRYTERWASGLIFKYEESLQILSFGATGPIPRSQVDLGFGVFTRFYFYPQKTFKFILESSIIRIKTIKIWKINMEEEHTSSYLRVDLSPKLVYSVKGYWNILANFGEIVYQKKLNDYDGVGTHLSSEFSLQNISIGVELAF